MKRLATMFCGEPGGCPLLASLVKGQGKVCINILAGLDILSRKKSFFQGDW